MSKTSKTSKRSQFEITGIDNEGVKFKSFLQPFELEIEKKHDHYFLTFSDISLIAPKNYDTIECINFALENYKDYIDQNNYDESNFDETFEFIFKFYGHTIKKIGDLIFAFPNKIRKIIFFHDPIPIGNYGNIKLRIEEMKSEDIHNFIRSVIKRKSHVESIYFYETAIPIQITGEKYSSINYTRNNYSTGFQGCDNKRERILEKIKNGMVPVEGSLGIFQKILVMEDRFFNKDDNLEKLLSKGLFYFDDSPNVTAIYHMLQQIKFNKPDLCEDLEI